MATINEVRTEPVRAATSHKNWMGGESWDIGNPILNLRLAASSCFFGEPQYYHRDSSSKHRSDILSNAQLVHLEETLGGVSPVEWRGLSSREMMERAIDAALEFDPELTLQEAVRLRTEEYIRVTPQVILVRAANHKAVKGTGLIRKYAPGIIARADEPSTVIAYQMAVYGKPIPNSLKRAVADALVKFNEYQLAKYRMGSRQYKTVDVVNLVHPRATEALTKLVNDELTNTGNTWEAIISQKGSTPANWAEAYAKMGHMALLRNLRNLAQHDAVSRADIVTKLKAGVEGGKQLPFRYYSAYKNLPTGEAILLDGVEECLEMSFANAPHFAGRTMSLCDNSGSAWGSMTSSLGTMHVAEIANLTAVITARASDEGHVGIFGDRLETFAYRSKSSIFDQVDKAGKLGRSVGGATENGIWLFWDKAIREDQHWDSVFVYSDMQAGHGGLYGSNPSAYNKYRWPGDSRYTSNYIDVPKLINDYRAKVNPNVKVFLVQVAGYQDTIVPEFYKNTYILGGWGDGILRFAADMSQLPPAQ